jgi:hypothetical protein
MNTLSPEPAWRVRDHGYTSWGSLHFTVTDPDGIIWDTVLTPDGRVAARSLVEGLPDVTAQLALRETVTRYLFEIVRIYDACPGGSGEVPS